MLDSFITLDLETTGINPRIDRIIEIGMAKVVAGNIVDTYTTLIYPGIKISERITELTGITNEDLKGKPRIEDVIDEVVTFIGEGPILGHNVIFDYSFLKKAALNNNLTIPDDGIDTLKIARVLLPELEHRNLTYLCEYYQVDPGKSHRALDDALSALEVYKKMYEIKPDYKGFNETFKLVFAVKKDAPITIPQKNYLSALVAKHNLSLDDLDMPIDEMTKSMASRNIDRIIAQYGK